MWPRSVRARLTLWYVGIITAILVAVSAAVYLTMRSTLREQLDDNLDNRAFYLRALVSVDTAGQPHLDTAANPDADDTFQRLLDPSGAVVSESSDIFAPFAVEREAVSAALRGNAPHRATLSAQGHEARVVTVPLRASDDAEPYGILQVGESTDDLDEALNTLLMIFGVAALPALGVAVLGGWWLASRALAPVDRMTRAAREISEGRDLGRRLNISGPDDELGRLANTFDAMLARLDAAFQRQRQFTSDASHELRTPLTAIRGQIDVALERPRNNAEYRRVLEEVNGQVARMTRLVGGLLMLARSDAGQLPLHRERVDVAELVASVADQVRRSAEQKGLELRIERGSATAIRGDEGLLLQLMLNVADNAVKYTRAGIVTLGWSAGPPVTLFVRDTGAGIPEEHRARIFERFYRADPSRSGEGAGTGLGLAISRWIAEAHGGTLTFESGPGGSAFSVSLPALHEEISPASSPLHDPAVR